MSSTATDASAFPSTQGDQDPSPAEELSHGINQPCGGTAWRAKQKRHSAKKEARGVQGELAKTWSRTKPRLQACSDSEAGS